MTASCFSTSLQSPLLVLPPRPRRRVRSRLRSGSLLLPMLVAALLGVALVTPEQPRAQAEICERHNGVAACRVW